MKYKTKSEWFKSDKNSYQASIYNDWLKKLTAHKGNPNETNTLLKVVMPRHLKCQTKAEWKKKGEGSYRAAIKYGWSEKCCKHMLKRGQKEAPEHTLEMCKKISVNYDSLYDWRLHSPRSFKDALKNGWIK